MSVRVVCFSACKLRRKIAKCEILSSSSRWMVIILCLCCDCSQFIFKDPELRK